ncbi:SMP-30/Gluconolaconase/LRE-like region [Pirellulimonas nuda]|uniref:SMP-30/Gluconolaconase/LRE-like region n=1 Tax=Pirellulimonas nuda TaxID=2528009 RepID=A0A518D5Z4_9BACT|nr:hypothetical protein [Pirellulimonas nuda]QDU86893.1 SMP-30/Gluconolaconase/LRE-like region [Pirellulimonas nuda]
MLRADTSKLWLGLALAVGLVAWTHHSATADTGGADAQQASADTMFDAARAPACEAQACEEAEACAEQPCETETSQVVAVAPATKSAADGVAATHKQTGIIKANVPGHAQVTAECFCIAGNDNLLIGCHASDSKAENKDEVRVFDPSGGLVAALPLPFTPDAINVDPSGNILVAGAGELVRMTIDGQQLHRAKAPHVSGMSDEERGKLREQIVTQHERTAKMYTQQADRYTELVVKAEQQLEEVTQQLEALKADEEQKDGKDEDDVAAGRKQAVLAARTSVLKRQLTQYKRMQEQWDTMISQMGETKPLTDEQVDQQIEAALRSKMAVSSVSSAGGHVFVACRSTVGYGYEVWKMDDQFADGEVIIKGLSGCCGQMDVQACDGGLFVAENSKHRASRYNLDGEAEKHWGTGDRTSLEGFGSCCNPMNVAFGPGGAVYTAEDDTGRIKRYSPDGELLGLVGKVDLVPGCKNVAIGVSSDGDHVYMIDVNRHHVVRMDRISGDAAQPVAQASYEEASHEEDVHTTETPAQGSSSPIVGVLKLLSGQ